MDLEKRGPKGPVTYSATDTALIAVSGSLLIAQWSESQE
jgi:hypothetical protein